MADAKTLFVLLESSAGYALFEVISLEEIGVLLEDAAAAVVDMDRFGRSVKLKAFYPFESAQEALDNANALSEHAMCDTLHNFLEMNVPSSYVSTDKKKKGSKTAAFSVGVVDPGLATAIADGLGISCRSDDTVREVLRGCRLHLERFVKGLGGGVGGAATTADAASAGSAGSSSSGGGSVAVRAQLGLGHAYSRSKVKFNPARSDNMIIQSIAILDQLDKDINTFAMRVREWYSWHFPELKDLVPDNVMYARCAALIQNKSRLVASSSSSSPPDNSEGNKKKDGDNDDDDDEEEEEEIKQGDDDEDSSPSSLVRDLASQVLGGDAEWAERIRAAAKMSIGMDCADADMVNICNFTDRMVQLAAYRQRMVTYLNAKMNIVAPNLSAILGDSVAARLISKAGSLTNLAKAPASTVQILGAEKALFRALKTKGNTPKYGLIYHSTFIGRAAAKNKGRISRYLANKCSIATRIDSFSDYAATGNAPNSLYGEKLRDQVEERLQFYETGKAPRRNLDVMEEVSRQLKRAAAGATGGGSNDTEDDAMDVDDDAEEDTTKKKPSATKDKKKEKKKKAKKDKKRKRSEAGLEEEDGDANDNDNDEKQAEEKKPEQEPVAASDENKAAKKKAAKKAKQEAAAAAAAAEKEEDVETKKTEQEPVVDEKAAKKSAKKARKEAAAAAAAEEEEEDEEVAERKKTAQQEPVADDEKAAKKASKKAKKEAAAAAAEKGEEEGGAAAGAEEADEKKKKKKDKKKKKSKN